MILTENFASFTGYEYNISNVYIQRSKFGRKMNKLAENLSKNLFHGVCGVYFFKVCLCPHGLKVCTHNNGSSPILTSTVFFSCYHLVISVRAILTDDCSDNTTDSPPLLLLACPPLFTPVRGQAIATLGGRK